MFEHPLDTATLEEIRNEAKAALEEAMARDRALIEVIRDELRRVPEAALQSPALPAVHRGLWQRRKTADD